MRELARKGGGQLSSVLFTFRLKEVEATPRVLGAPLNLTITLASGITGRGVARIICRPSASWLDPRDVCQLGFYTNKPCFLVMTHKFGPNSKKEYIISMTRGEV
jgi:hypothetical protein